MESAAGKPRTPTTLKRSLRLTDLLLYGIIVIQPTAPLPIFGVLALRSGGQAVTTILLAMIAMLLTAISYGRMASIYPSAGSAFTYVGKESIHQRDLSPDGV
jgi:amino acid transporter